MMEMTAPLTLLLLRRLTALLSSPKPAANPPTLVSSFPGVFVDVEDQQADGNPADDSAS